jgi:hypothetical protein
MKKLLLFMIATIAISCNEDDTAVQVTQPTNFMVGSWKVLQVYNQGDILDVSDCANYLEYQPYTTYLFTSDFDMDSYNSCTGAQTGDLDNDISSYTVAADTYTVHADFDTTFRVVDMGGEKRKWVALSSNGIEYDEGDFYYIVEKQ